MNLHHIKVTALLLGVWLLAHSSASLADRADHDKPIYLEADQVDIDDAKQVSVFSGHVMLTQGTLVIHGDQLVVTQDKSGFRHGTATGKLASFRQKREGLNEYVEGYGERIEYDTGSEIMNIFVQAHVKRGLDDVRGEHITYNIKTEIFQASGAPDKAESSGKNQRVRVVIQPKDTASAPAAASTVEPLSIKPDTRLIQQETAP